MDFLGHRIVERILVEGDRLFKGIDEQEAGMAVFHVPFQLPAELRVEFPFNVVGKFFQYFPAFHSGSPFDPGGFEVTAQFGSGSIPFPFRNIRRASPAKLDEPDEGGILPPPPKYPGPLPPRRWKDPRRPAA
jgi:hypothetical protein